MRVDEVRLDLQKIADEIGIQRNDRLTMGNDELISFILGTIHVIMSEGKFLKKRNAQLERENAKISQLPMWGNRRPCDI